MTNRIFRQGKTYLILLIMSLGIQSLLGQNVTLEQTIDDSGNPSDVTFQANAIGNLLILVTGMRTGDDPGSEVTLEIDNNGAENVALGGATASGWTLVVEDYFKTNGSTADRRGLAIFYKIATAAEVAPNNVLAEVRWTNGGGNSSLIFREFSLDNGYEFIFDQATSNNSGTGDPDILSTGTTGASSYANSLLITGLMSRDNANNINWTNGVGNTANEQNGGISVHTAYGTSTGLTTKESTASWDDDRRATAGITVFGIQNLTQVVCSYPISWLEDFEDLNVGDQSDVGTTAWTNNGGDGDVQQDPADATDLNFSVTNEPAADGEWQSETFDVSQATTVNFSIDVSQIPVNQDFETDDDLEVAYLIDGVKVVIETFNRNNTVGGGDDDVRGDETVTATIDVSAATTFAVLVTMNTDNNDETYQIDNISVNYTITSFTEAIFTASGSCTVNFDATPSQSCTGSLTYSWDFDGDGTEDATGATTSFDYASVGTFNPILTVTDADGNSASSTVAVTTVATVAAFTTTTNAGDTDVTFDASGSIGSGLTYSWDFDGDGIEDSNTGPSVNFDYGGFVTNNVELTVSNSCGSDSETQSVTTSDCVNVPPNFTEQAGAFGLNVINQTIQNGADKDGGSAWEDFNNDGCLDVIINTANGNARTRILEATGCVNGNPTGGFIDVTPTKAEGLLDRTMERSVIWADVNNDGFIDLIRNTSDVGGVDEIALEVYVNRGPVGSAIRAEMGVPATEPDYSFGLYLNAGEPQQPNFVIQEGNDVDEIPDDINLEGLAWIDYNNDGLLDMIIDNHNQGLAVFENNTDNPAFDYNDPNNNAAPMFFRVNPPGLPPTGMGEAGATDADYLTVGDVNGDGYLDIFARKDNGRNLYINDRDGSFTIDPTVNPQADNDNKGANLMCDFDNDGDFDLLWTDNDDNGNGNQIWLNDGALNPTFTLQDTPDLLEDAANLPAGGIAGEIDGAACGDIDGDGDIDVFLSSSAGTSYLMINQFVETGTLSFENDNRGINVDGDGEGVNLVDFDGDGDLDLYINVDDEDNQLWVNNGTVCNVLKVEVLQCVRPSLYREAIGATIEVSLSGSPTLIAGQQDVNSAKGHGSQNPLTAVFGVPNENATYDIFVQFPPFNVDLDGNGTIENPNGNGDNEILVETFTATIVPSDFTNNTVQITSFNSIEGGAGNCVDQILPVRLVNFGAFPEDEIVKIHWITAGEEGNSHFIVERSADGEEFEPITRVEGNGTTKETQTYTSTDPDPYLGHSYYRLKQVDFNGAVSYSKVVHVYFEPEKTTNEFTVLGNPVLEGNPIRAMYFASGRGESTLTLHDMMGRVHFTEQRDFPASGLYDFRIPTQKLPKGIYLLRLQTNTEEQVRKVVIR
ncbi:MAG: FG-GAP-like repeat-containing protein [Bacteroidota bacterium]